MDEQKRKKLIMGGVALLVILGLFFLIREVSFRMTHVSTNNAQIEGDFYYVAPKVGGMIKEVLVKNNDLVKAGQELARLDSVDYELGRTSAEANYVKAKNDYDRILNLYKDGLASKQERDHAQAAFESSQAGYHRESQNVSYTTLAAPVAGMIGRKSAEPGQVVAPGQALMVVVPLNGLYIVANIKETEIGRIKSGQKVEIKIDAYGNRTFKGHVDSFGAATGAKFSLLPPDNAAGNFVKVVQLVPVKIFFEPGEMENVVIRPGMSVEVAVETQ